MNLAAQRSGLRYPQQGKGIWMDKQQTVFIVDDDEHIREGLGLLLESVGQAYQLYGSAAEVLKDYQPSKRGCLVLDIRMPRMSGLELQHRLNELGYGLPIIFITGHGDIAMAVEAMRCGAEAFIRKPFREQELLDRTQQALHPDPDKHTRLLNRKNLLDKIGTLSAREREVFDLVADGKMNKTIATDLNISERTVEVHRSKVMTKLAVKTLAQLVRIKLEAEMQIRE